MIQNYKARIDALHNIQNAIDDLSNVVIRTPLLISSIVNLKAARRRIIKEMHET